MRLGIQVVVNAIVCSLVMLLILVAAQSMLDLAEDSLFVSTIVGGVSVLSRLRARHDVCLGAGVLAGEGRLRLGHSCSGGTGGAGPGSISGGQSWQKLQLWVAYLYRYSPPVLLSCFSKSRSAVSLMPWVAWEEPVVVPVAEESWW